jgi:hypothetical protein
VCACVGTGSRGRTAEGCVVLGRQWGGEERSCCATAAHIRRRGGHNGCVAGLGGGWLAGLAGRQRGGSCLCGGAEPGCVWRGAWGGCGDDEGVGCLVCSEEEGAWGVGNGWAGVGVGHVLGVGEGRLQGAPNQGRGLFTSALFQFLVWSAPPCTTHRSRSLHHPPTNIPAPPTNQDGVHFVHNRIVQRPPDGLRAGSGGQPRSAC